MEREKEWGRNEITIFRDEVAEASRDEAWDFGWIPLLALLIHNVTQWAAKIEGVGLLSSLSVNKEVRIRARGRLRLGGRSGLELGRGER